MSYRGEPFDEKYYIGNHSQGYSDYFFEAKRAVPRADNIELYRSVKDQDVLVVGCAFGYLCNELTNRNANVTGIDISNYAITQAKLLFPSLNFIEDDFLKYNFQSDIYDLIICINVIGCLIDKNQALSWFEQTKKVVRDSGWIYCLVEGNNDFYLILSNLDYNNVGDSNFQEKAVEITNVGHLPITSDRRVVYY